jgi:hypothetical protein
MYTNLGGIFFSPFYKARKTQEHIFYSPFDKARKTSWEQFFNNLFILPCQHNWRPMGNDDQIALHSDCMMSNVLLEVASLSVLLQKHPTPRPLS